MAYSCAVQEDCGATYDGGRGMTRDIRRRRRRSSEFVHPEGVRLISRAIFFAPIALSCNGCNAVCGGTEREEPLIAGQPIGRVVG